MIERDFCQQGHKTASSHARSPKKAAGPWFPKGPRPRSRCGRISRVLSLRLFPPLDLDGGSWSGHAGMGGHFSRRDVAVAVGTLVLPGGRGAPQRSTRPHTAGPAAGDPVRRTGPPKGLRDLARGGVYRAPAVTSRAVRSYRNRFTLTFRGPEAPDGGLFSVALSRAPRSRAGGWALPTAVSCRARTFLCRSGSAPRGSGRLSAPS